MTLGGLVDLLGAHFAVAHLNSLVAVRLNGLLLHDGAGAGLDDGDRNDLAVASNSWVMPSFLPMIPFCIVFVLL